MDNFPEIQIKENDFKKKTEFLGKKKKPALKTGTFKKSTFL